MNEACEDVGVSTFAAATVLLPQRWSPLSADSDAMSPTGVILERIPRHRLSIERLLVGMCGEKKGVDESCGVRGWV